MGREHRRGQHEAQRLSVGGYRVRSHGLNITPKTYALTAGLQRNVAPRNRDDFTATSAASSKSPRLVDSITAALYTEPSALRMTCTYAVAVIRICAAAAGYSGEAAAIVDARRSGIEHVRASVSAGGASCASAARALCIYCAVYFSGRGKPL